MESKVEHPCPACGEEDCLNLLANTSDIPYFGEHTQITLSCNSCGLRQTDFIPSEERGPTGHRLLVSEEEHLNVRVVRGPSATIRIPELDLEIAPGSHASGYVTNIEGLIRRFADIIQMMARQIEKEESEGVEGASSQLAILSMLEEAILTAVEEPGKVSIELELLDPKGHSSIGHEDAETWELKQDEIDELDPGPNPMIFESSDLE